MASIRRQAADFATEWQKLIAHFDWAEGFSLVILFVPDAEGAAVRRRALERYLTSKGKSLIPVTFNDPEELKLLANRLFDLDASADAGAVWVEAVIHETDERFEQWEAAWREGAARLNQYRNPLRRKFQIPLVFVAAPWTQPRLVLAGRSPPSSETRWTRCTARSGPLKTTSLPCGSRSGRGPDAMRPAPSGLTTCVRAGGSIMSLE